MGSFNRGRRKRLHAAQDGRCYWCGQTMTLKPGHENTTTVEHLYPIGKGGLNVDRNIVGACHRCNTLRGSTDAIEFQEMLKAVPLTPTSQPIGWHPNRLRMRRWRRLVAMQQEISS